MDLPKRAVVISINGLRPAFYSDDKFHAPCLKRLAALGATATGALAVYPSLTYPCHTTLITGVRPRTPQKPTP